MMLSDDVRDLTIDPDHRVSFWHSGKLRKVGPRGSRAPVRSELSSGSEDELPHKVPPPTPAYREVIYISSDSDDSDGAPATPLSVPLDHMINDADRYTPTRWTVRDDETRHNAGFVQAMNAKADLEDHGLGHNYDGGLLPPIYHVVNESVAYCKTSIEASPAHATVVESSAPESRESVVARALARLKDVVPDTPQEDVDRMVAERVAREDDWVDPTVRADFDAWLLERELARVEADVNQVTRTEDLLDEIDRARAGRHTVLSRVDAGKMRQRAKTWRSMTGIFRPNTRWNPVDLTQSD